MSSGIKPAPLRSGWLLAALALSLLLLILLATSSTVSIQAGEAGVLFKPFSGGLVRDQTYDEGVHLIAPWNRMYVYDIRQQQVAESLNVLSSNGLEISVDLSVWYRPEKKMLGLLHGEIGTDYESKIVVPSLRSASRSVVGRYTPEEIYSTKRESIQNEVFTETSKLLNRKYVHLDQVLIREIRLPATIKTAIESKLKQEQEALEYEFKLQKATQEAQRQRIEAEGKAAANRIISQSLSDLILREKGIEATLKLSESPNSKVVIIGSGREGMPLILNP
jgi:regulator of protease activity HflC (stomatin/prohibitin superfamily)